MKTFKIILPILLVILAFACKKDVLPDDNDDNDNPNNYTIDKGVAKTASFYGVIVDENENPIASANLTIGNTNITSDVDGKFIVEDAAVFEKHAHLKFSKDGYFQGSKSIIPTDGFNKINLMLRDRVLAGTFNASAGGTINKDGLVVKFEAGVVDASGIAYTGNVNVYTDLIDLANDSKAFAKMPGNLKAADEEGEKIIIPFNTATVELEDNNGGKLQLAEGTEATIYIPASSFPGAPAHPATTVLWNYNNTEGYWVKEGTASLENNKYVSKVKHFSTYVNGIDIKNNVLKGKILQSNGEPFSHAKVFFEPEDEEGWFLAYNAAGTDPFFRETDENGEFSYPSVKDSKLKFTVFQSCINNERIAVYYNEIGPFTTEEVIIPDVTALIVPSVVTITGSIKGCDLLPNQTSLFGNIGTNSNALPSDDSFSFTVCSPYIGSIGISDELASNSFFNIDFNNLTSSIDIGNIVACDNFENIASWNFSGIDYYSTDGSSQLNILVDGAGNDIGFEMNGPVDSIRFDLGSLDVGVYSFDENSDILEGIVHPSIWVPGSNAISISIQESGAYSGNLIKGTISGTYEFDDGGLTYNETVNGTFEFLRP